MLFSYITIGKRLRNYRLKKHYSQAELADMVNVSAAAISSFETGTKCMSLETLISIVNVLGITTDVLLSDCLANHIIVSIQEFSSIFEDVSLYESRIIIDNAKTLKDILRNNRFALKNPVDSL